MSKPSNTPPPLLTVRAAVVLLVGLVLGTIVGVLTFVASQNIATAALGGLAAAGPAVAFLHKAIGPA